MSISLRPAHQLFSCTPCTTCQRLVDAASPAFCRSRGVPPRFGIKRRDAASTTANNSRTIRPTPAPLFCLTHFTPFRYHTRWAFYIRQFRNGDFSMPRRAHGLTRIEVLMLAGIFASLGIMLLPWLQYAREMARQRTCMKHMQHLACGFLNYETRNTRFPASSGVTRAADGGIQAVDGWSWMVEILPFLIDPQDAVYRTPDPAAKGLFLRLDVKNGRPLEERPGVAGTPHADALATQFPWLRCPSYSGSPYADPATRKAAITNYRILGATHIESLSIASPHPLIPKYQPTPSASCRPAHPDGFCFPGLPMPVSMNFHGACQLWLTESLEPRFSRWTVGAEATVVGLPPTVEFERDFGETGFWVPRGHAVAVGKSLPPAADEPEQVKSDLATLHDLRQTEVNQTYRKVATADPDGDAVYWTYQTYLDWDYKNRPYDGADGMQAGRYGPSSNHPHVVHHAFLDGSVHLLSTDIDVTTYMSMISRTSW